VHVLRRLRRTRRGCESKARPANAGKGMRAACHPRLLPGRGHQLIRRFEPIARRFPMRILGVLIVLLLASTSAVAQDKVVLIIHGGAGSLSKKDATPELKKEYHEALEK